MEKKSTPVELKQTNPASEVSNKIAKLEKEIAQLRDILNVKDNWHSETRDLIGKPVSIMTMGGSIFIGTLLWSDRYNVCILVKDSRRIFPKGGIVSIEHAS